MSRFVDSVSGFRFKLDILYANVYKIKYSKDKAQLIGYELNP